MSGPTRRTLLRALGAGAALGLGLGPRARAFGDVTRVDIAELDLGEGTTSRPRAWERLLYDIQQSSSVDTRQQSVVIDPSTDALFDHPFCVLLGTDAFAPVSEEVLDRLSQYLAYGGFLFVDDTTGGRSEGFDRSVRRLVSRLFPTRVLAPLAGDHSVYRAFFLIRQPVGRVASTDHLEGVAVGTLTPLMYCRNDLSGALDRTPDGRWANAVVPGGEGQRDHAKHLGVNLMLYSLTANYKNDQVHIRELMLDGRMPE